MSATAYDYHAAHLNWVDACTWDVQDRIPYLRAVCPEEDWPVLREKLAEYKTYDEERLVDIIADYYTRVYGEWVLRVSDEGEVSDEDLRRFAKDVHILIRTVRVMGIGWRGVSLRAIKAEYDKEDRERVFDRLRTHEFLIENGFVIVYNGAYCVYGPALKCLWDRLHAA